MRPMPDRAPASDRASADARGACIDVSAVEAAPLQSSPFDHIVVRDVISSGMRDAVLASFPETPGPGSHMPTSLRIAEPFSALLADLEGAAFRAALERKFAVDLAGRPTLTTIRAAARASDGAAHTDSRSKFITVLLYLNPDWTSPGGRLRLLRSPDIEDCAAEIIPEAGTLLAFRRSETSWHGHRPFAGPRRAVQMSYVVDAATAAREERRHRFSTALKRVAGRLAGFR